MCSDGVVAKQLARAVFVWMGTAGHLIWPSFITEKKIHCNSFPLQVVLAHPTYRFPFLTRTVRERIPVAGYSIFKLHEGYIVLSPSYYNLQSPKRNLFF